MIVPDTARGCVGGQQWLRSLGSCGTSGVLFIPNFLDVFLRKALLRKDFLLICATCRSHVMVFRKFLPCNDLRDSPCTQKAVRESGCSIDVKHCLATTCN